MKTLVFGAGPLGSLYARLLIEAGNDVTILARGGRFEFIQENGLVLKDEFSGITHMARIPVVDSLQPDDAYDLIIVLVRKNKLPPVFEILKQNKNASSIIFMGNNVLGFEEYTRHLPPEKILFGFPGAGGSITEQIVHYVDRESPDGKRMEIRIGEMDAENRPRTRQIAEMFEKSGVPVSVIPKMDGWLKYHAAFVLPIGAALYKHDCDSLALASDKESLRLFLKACRDAGNVLSALGYKKRQPFKFNLFYWLPDALTIKIFSKMFSSKFAEIAFGLHARAARDEMEALLEEFDSLKEKSGIKTPAFDELMQFARSIHAA